ncbi:hypothetical protein HK104_008465 [Borealophlyctis nickersoniae]|nr:hypothetical protein HK104_008465 [Borealophlyctis nickersoniae]
MSAPSKSQSAKEACLESVVTYLKGLPKPNLLAILATSREELAIDLEKVLNTARKKEDRADVTAQLKDMAYQVRKNECQFIEGNKLLEDLGIGAKRTAEELAEAAPTPKRAKHIGLDISAEVFDDHLAPSVPALLHIQDYGQKASSTA